MRYFLKTILKFASSMDSDPQISVGFQRLGFFLTPPKFYPHR